MIIFQKKIINLLHPLSICSTFNCIQRACFEVLDKDGKEPQQEYCYNCFNNNYYLFELEIEKITYLEKVKLMLLLQQNQIYITSTSSTSFIPSFLLTSRKQYKEVEEALLNNTSSLQDLNPTLIFHTFKEYMIQLYSSSSENYIAKELWKTIFINNTYILEQLSHKLYNCSTNHLSSSFYSYLLSQTISDKENIFQFLCTKKATDFTNPSTLQQINIEIEQIINLIYNNITSYLQEEHYYEEEKQNHNLPFLRITSPSPSLFLFKNNNNNNKQQKENEYCAQLNDHYTKLTQSIFDTETDKRYMAKMGFVSNNSDMNRQVSIETNLSLESSYFSGESQMDMSMITTTPPISPKAKEKEKEKGLAGAGIQSKMYLLEPQNGLGPRITSSSSSTSLSSISFLHVPTLGYNNMISFSRPFTPLLTEEEKQDFSLLTSSNNKKEGDQEKNESSDSESSYEDNSESSSYSDSDSCSSSSSSSTTPVSKKKKVTIRKGKKAKKEQPQPVEEPEKYEILAGETVCLGFGKDPPPSHGRPTHLRSLFRIRFKEIFKKQKQQARNILYILP